MRTGCLFSGYGGLSMAVNAYFGASTAWFSEIDDAPARILAHHWPDVPNHGDITEIDWAAVEPVDILCGGFPCQDVSAAGRRAGIREGTRSGLWSYFAEAINQLRPRYVVIENVRGLLSAEAHRPMESAADALGDRSSQPVLRALGAVLGDLSDLGYDAQWCTVAAADVGACHRRERVFILATPADTERDESERRRGSGLVGGAPGEDQGAGEERQRDGHTPRGGGAEAVALLPTPRAAEAKMAMGAPGAARHVAAGNGALTEVLGVHLLPTPRASDGTKGGPNQRGSSGDLMLPSAVQLLPTPLDNRSPQVHAAVTVRARPVGVRCAGCDYEAAIRRAETACGRPAPSPTEPNRNGNPRLSARFAEWMMMLPDGWVTDSALGLTRNEQLKALGNGVVPAQAYAALCQLVPIAEVTA